jgi:hypothetical protein
LPYANNKLCNLANDNNTFSFMNEREDIIHDMISTHHE